MASMKTPDQMVGKTLEELLSALPPDHPAHAQVARIMEGASQRGRGLDNRIVKNLLQDALELPGNYGFDDKGVLRKGAGTLKKLGMAAATMAVPFGAAALAPALGGVSAAQGAAVPAGASAGATAAPVGTGLTSAVGTGAAGVSGAASGSSALEKLLSGASKGSDALGWASLGTSVLGGLLGGEDEEDPRFDPELKNYISDYLKGELESRQSYNEANPVKLRSSYVQGGPSPVSVPGVPFQIGAGMGQDPALADPTLLGLPARLKKPGVK